MDKATTAPLGAYDEAMVELGESMLVKCRHGHYLRCDECVDATHALAIAIGRHEGAVLAAQALKDATGRLFADGKDEEARLLREHMRTLERQAERYSEQADEIREQQGIIKRGRR